MVGFIARTRRDRLDVVCFYISTSQSGSKDCRKNGLADICVSSVYLYALQLGPQCSTNALHISSKFTTLTNDLKLETKDVDSRTCVRSSCFQIRVRIENRMKV